MFSHIGSKLYYFFISPVAGVMNNTNNDMLEKIMFSLSLKDLNLQRLVSKRFRVAAEFVFEFCHLPLIPKNFPFKNESQLPSQKVIEFHSECDKISQNYSSGFIKAMGVEKIALLPKKNATEIETMMGRNELIIHLSAKINSSEKTELLSEKISFFKIVNQQNTQLCIFEGTGKIFPLVQPLNYLKRLANKEPCGKIVEGKETEPKVAEQGQSLVQLCDEKGEVLDASPIGKALKF